MLLLLLLLLKKQAKNSPPCRLPVLVRVVQQLQTEHAAGPRQVHPVDQVHPVGQRDLGSRTHSSLLSKVGAR